MVDIQTWITALITLHRLDVRDREITRQINDLKTSMLIHRLMLMFWLRSCGYTVYDDSVPPTTIETYFEILDWLRQ